MSPIEQKDKILKIIDMFYPNAKVYLFGSYARGDAIRGSDIDIAIDNNAPLDIIDNQKIREMIDVLGLVQRVDVVDFQRIPATMKDNILREGIVWKS